MSAGPTTRSDRTGSKGKWGGLLPRFGDVRIRSKLTLILIVPVLAVLGLATVRLVDVGQEAAGATQIRTLTSLGHNASALAQDVHKERMAAAAFLAQPRAKADPYNQRIRDTDRRIEDYEAARAEIGDVPALVQARLTVIDENLEALTSLRQQILDNRQMSVSQVILRYGMLFNSLISYNEGLSQLPGVDELSESRRALASFALAKAAVAEEEVTIYIALSAQGGSYEQFSTFMATLTGQQEAMLDFTRSADAEQRALVSATVAGDAVVLADRVTSDVTRSINAPVGLVTAAEATAAVGAVNDLMRWAEVRMEDRLLAQVEGARSEVVRRAGIEAIVVAATLILAVALAVFLARSLNSSLRRLREGALGVANKELPEAVSRFRDIDSIGEGGVEALMRDFEDPIRLENRDEIGEVGDAFNVVHKEAVRVAAEQAALRTSVSAMFLNLARRSQTLVDRMIGELDRIERAEEDPKRLAQLFELDHLATRMRRNDENLLVLAGADSAMPRREDALLVDALRAAQSEVEAYNRIEFGTVDTDISVAAHAVNDVVRLVAELLDNATRFSPPDAVVVADARRVRDYVLIQIEDRGLGLTDEQLDALNERLSAPPSVDVMAFRLMGLAVVSRLSNRYGIRVELRRNVEGGTVAQVTLPSSTVVLPKVRGREQILAGPPRQLTAQPEAPMAVAPPAAPPVNSARPTLPQQWRQSTSTLGRQWRQGQETPGGQPVGGRAEIGEAAAPAQADWPVRSPEPAPSPSVSAPKMGGYTEANGLPRRTPEAARPGADAQGLLAAQSPAPAAPAQSFAPAPPAQSFGSAQPAAPAVPAQYTPRSTPLPSGPVAGLAAASAPGVRRPEERAEAPIFREMEAVWFRSHGNDSTAIFERPSFDDPPAPAAPATPASFTAATASYATVPPARPAAPSPATAAHNTAPPPPSYTPPAGGRPGAGQSWRTAADEGWARASRAAEPEVTGTTRSGLPKRVPQAQLVPGGVDPSAAKDRTRRSPDQVRGLLSAYHRGVQRGRSAGGDPIGNSSKETRQ